LIAHVSAIFLLPVFEKSVIFSDFRAIAHSISAREGGNTVCWKGMNEKKTDDDSVTYWFPWKHLMARRRWLEFGVFDQTLPKISSAARPYGPRRWIFFPPQNYNSQTIGSTLRASPFASFGTFARKHTPNVGSALRASPLERRKCTGRHFFALSMSASRSRTCCARLRPRRVFGVGFVGLQMIRAKYNSHKPTGRFAQDDLRNRG